MVEAPWSKSVDIDVDGSWPPGDYLLKLVADDVAQRYVPLTIRDDSSTAALVVQNEVTTWQAYDQWGGYSLYAGGSGPGSFERRARVVSFDRPYARGDGASDFIGLELPLVAMAESLGLDVTYWTDVDLHARPELLTRHRALLTLGHDEYWSRAMRDGAENARDHGVNLAFLGANAVFRQIRLEPSPLGANRHEVAYKSATADPLRRTNPAEVTVNWRDAPVSRPESSLIGQQYECNPVRADMVIADGAAWVFAGTGLKTGDKLLGTIGEEYDRYNPNDPGPENVQLLAHSPVRCGGRSSYADMTYYSAPSGAGVFASGTIWWVTKLVPPAGGRARTTPPSSRSRATCSRRSQPARPASPTRRWRTTTRSGAAYEGDAVADGADHVHRAGVGVHVVVERTQGLGVVRGVASGRSPGRSTARCRPRSSRVRRAWGGLRRSSCGSSSCPRR